jgi:hypothetical protein
MSLDTTVGGPTSNSYVSVSEANSYFNNHYSVAKKTLWNTLGQPQKEFALKRACQQIETICMLDDELSTGRLPIALVIDLGYDLSIHRAEFNQRLQLPRNLDVDVTGAPFVPQVAKDAQCEQAVYLLAFDDATLITMSQGITEDLTQAGPVKTFTKYAQGMAPTYLSPMVVELLREFFRITGRVRRA